MLAKFKVVQKETNSKLAPLAKMETGQLLDCSTIFKAQIKSGLLAVSSKDGHISFNSTSLDDKGKIFVEQIKDQINSISFTTVVYSKCICDWFLDFANFCSKAFL